MLHVQKIKEVVIIGANDQVVSHNSSCQLVMDKGVRRSDYFILCTRADIATKRVRGLTPRGRAIRVVILLVSLSGRCGDVETGNQPRPIYKWTITLSLTFYRERMVVVVVD